MGKITFITGGARSGKSRFAEELLCATDNVIYIATAIPFDGEMRERILLHKSRRNPRWRTLEAYRDLGSVYHNCTDADKCVLLDCLTIMVSNLMMENGETGWENPGAKAMEEMELKIENEIKKFLQGAGGFAGSTIIVSNETGMGIVPPSPLGRYFRDFAGRANQRVAAAADTVYFMVSGIPVRIKGE